LISWLFWCEEFTFHPTTFFLPIRQNKLFEEFYLSPSCKKKKREKQKQNKIKTTTKQTKRKFSLDHIFVIHLQKEMMIVHITQFQP